MTFSFFSFLKNRIQVTSTQFIESEVNRIYKTNHSEIVRKLGRDKFLLRPVKRTWISLSCINMLNIYVPEIFNGYCPVNPKTPFVKKT